MKHVLTMLVLIMLSLSAYSAEPVIIQQLSFDGGDLVVSSITEVQRITAVPIDSGLTAEEMYQLFTGEVDEIVKQDNKSPLLRLSVPIRVERSTVNNVFKYQEGQWSKTVLDPVISQSISWPITISVFFIPLCLFWFMFYQLQRHTTGAVKIFVPALIILCSPITVWCFTQTTNWDSFPIVFVICFVVTMGAHIFVVEWTDNKCHGTTLAAFYLSICGSIVVVNTTPQEGFCYILIMVGLMNVAYIASSRWDITSVPPMPDPFKDYE